MSGQILGHDRGQSKGRIGGVVGVNEVSDLILQDNYAMDGFVFLGRHDYSSTTFSGSITFATADNGGYLDPSQYRTHLVIAHQVRQSGPYTMNIVHSMTNLANTGSKSGDAYYSIGHETLQDSSDNNTYRTQGGGSYFPTSGTNLHTDDDSQATRLLWIYNMGDNERPQQVWWRDARRGNSYTGRHNSYDGSGTQLTIGGVGGIRFGGYTTSTWNGIFDIYGYKER